MVTTNVAATLLRNETLGELRENTIASDTSVTVAMHLFDRVLVTWKV